MARKTDFIRRDHRHVTDDVVDKTTGEAPAPSEGGGGGGSLWYGPFEIDAADYADPIPGGESAWAGIPLAIPELQPGDGFRYFLINIDTEFNDDQDASVGGVYINIGLPDVYGSTASSATSAPSAGGDPDGGADVHYSRQGDFGLNQGIAVFFDFVMTHVWVTFGTTGSGDVPATGHGRIWLEIIRPTAP